MGRHPTMGLRRHSLSALTLFFTPERHSEGAAPGPSPAPSPGPGPSPSPGPAPVPVPVPASEPDLDPEPEPEPEPEPDPSLNTDIQCPIGKIDSLSQADMRESAYEVFFMSCRSTPGFGGSRASLSYFPTSNQTGSAGDTSPQPVGPPPKSRIKTTLGLNSRRQPSQGSNSSGKARRPMTSAEIMRQQLRISQKNDHRLRKTLTKCLVGQAGKRADAIILPMELILHLKPMEFTDEEQYHQWQRRQLKILEISILLHPPFPFNPNHPSALRLQEIIRSSNLKPIDNSKNSEDMRSLCDCVVALAWHNTGGSADMCHWVVGFPLSIHLYLTLLRSIFDLQEATVVLDEVDELVDLMKRTWTTLGINNAIHNLCFTWIFFRQYIETGEIAPDLMTATLAMLAEVESDAKNCSGGRDEKYGKLFSATLGLMKDWAEKRTLNYHESFDAESAASKMEQVVSLAVSTSRMAGADEAPALSSSPDEDRVDYYIRSSIRKAFAKIQKESIEVCDEASKNMIQLVRETESLVKKESEIFGPVLKAMHLIPIAVAAVTIHACFGVVLKQYLAKVTSLTHEMVEVLHTAEKLENLLVQVAVEDSVDCDDGGKGIMREMTPYDGDTVIAGLLRSWINERLSDVKECLGKAKEAENWMQMSKTEPYAKSAVELMKMAKTTVDKFFETPDVGVKEEIVQELAGGLESIFHDYIAFVAECESKQSCVPTPSPLTRCNQGSNFAKVWKKAATVPTPPPLMRNQGTNLVKVWKKAAVKCIAVSGQCSSESSGEGSGNPRPPISRSTQRLYNRLNTLHYLLAQLHALDKSLSFSNKDGAAGSPADYFELACSEVETAIHNVAEVAAYYLVFVDTRQFYEGLYVDVVAESRIHPKLVILSQSVALLETLLVDQAKPLAVKGVMKAAVDAFLIVLLAGGTERAFKRADHDAVVEDFRSLKEMFSSGKEGPMKDEVVDRELEVAEGVVGLMALPTETLLEDFKEAASREGHSFEEGKLPVMSPTGRWNRADLNTLLRVLCHRDDGVANEFLKRTYQLPRRR